MTYGIVHSFHPAHPQNRFHRQVKRYVEYFVIASWTNLPKESIAIFKVLNHIDEQNQIELVLFVL
jgi:hypothetical protein